MIFMLTLFFNYASRSVLALSLFLLSNQVFSQNIQWAKTMGNVGSDRSTAIAVDVNGNVYTTGVFKETVDFDPGVGVYNLTSVGLADIFITKFDRDGNFIWAKSYGSRYQDYGCVSIKVNNSGNLVAVGLFKDTIGFVTKQGYIEFSSSQNMGYNSFILKFDSSGNIDWARQIKSYSFTFTPIQIDENGYVYLTGNFFTTTDFDLGSGVYNLTPTNTLTGNAFILKLNPIGDFVWAKMLGGRIGLGIAIDKLGNVITTGMMSRGTGDFDPGPSNYNLTSNIANTVYLSKLDSFGNFLWAGLISSQNNVDVGTVELDNADNIYLYGTFQRTTDFDIGNGINDITAPNGLIYNYIVKYNKNAALIWVKTYDEKLKINAMGLDMANDIYILGILNNTTDLDPNEEIVKLYGTGGFISKLDSSGKLFWAKKIGYALYTNSAFMAVEKTGGLYIATFFKGPINLDTTSNNFSFNTINDSLDILVFKIQGCIPLSVAGTISGPQSVCIGTKTSYTLNSPNEESNYLWSIPVGTIINNGQNSKTIQVTFGDSSGYISVVQKNTCSLLPPSVYAIQVRALKAPVIGALITPSSNVCKGTPAAIKGTGAKFYTLSDSLKENISFIVDTVKSFTIIGVDSNGCINSNSFTITTKQLPKLGAQVIPSSTVCNKTTVILNGTGANKYVWSNGIKNGVSFIAEPNLTRFKLIGTDTNTNCTDTLIQNIIVKPLPILTIGVAPSNQICLGDSVMIKATGANQYNWSDGITNGIYFKPASNRRYLLNAKDSNNCSDTTSFEIKIKPLPIIDISVYPSQYICKGESVLLKGKGALMYKWDNSVFDSSFFTPQVTKVYKVIGKDSNNCVSSKTIQITVNELPNIINQPKNKYVKVGDKVEISIESSDVIKSYKWQKYVKDSFVNLTDNNLYAGVNSNVLTIKQFDIEQHNSKFRCILNNGICNTISNESIIEIDSSNIRNLIYENGFAVFPNPTSDYLIIQGDQSIIGLTYYIIDGAGKLMLSGGISDLTTKINLEKLSQAIYLIYLNDKYLKTYKILKM